MKIFGFTLPNWSEVGWTRFVACIAVLILTVALACLNVSGAWIASGGNVAYTAVVCGVEMLAATTLVLVLAAPTWPRKIVGAITMCVIIGIAVANGQISVSNSFSTRFKDELGHTLSADALRKKADIASTDAKDLKTTDPVQRNKDQEDLATASNEMDLMSSPGRIKEAQTRLMALGLYAGKIDGLDQTLTSDARRSRGDYLRKRIETLTAKLDKSETPSSAKAVEAVDLTSRAKEIDEGYRWLYMLLIGCELARTAGLWAFVAWREEKPNIKVDPQVFADLQAQSDELARRKANIDAGVEKRETAKEKRDRERAEKAAKEAAILANKLAIEDFRSDQAKREAVEKELAAEAAVDPNAKAGPDTAAPSPAAGATPPQEAVPPEVVAEAEAPATSPSANDEDQEQSEAA